MDGWMDGWVGGWVDVWMDGWMDGGTDGWMDRWIDTYIDRQGTLWNNHMRAMRGYESSVVSLRLSNSIGAAPIQLEDQMLANRFRVLGLGFWV